MKKGLMILCLAVFLGGAVLVTPSYAHSNSLYGVFEKTAIAGSELTTTYYGSEFSGWRVDDREHLANDSPVTFYMEGEEGMPNYLDAQMHNAVINGAAKWRGIVTFNRIDNSRTAYGLIGTDFNDLLNLSAWTETKTTGELAAVDSQGHWTRWRIVVNMARTGQNATIFAHEFGHVIGLVHVTSASNSDKLMYDKPTASAPTTADKNGAKVILGLHTTHTWTRSGDYHYCTVCKGRNTHRYTYTQYNSSQHKCVCQDCGYITYESHRPYYNESLGRCKRCLYSGSITTRLLGQRE